jgi:hypothetical protein
MSTTVRQAATPDTPDAAAFARLPKWAQRKIDRLERERDAERGARQLAEARLDICLLGDGGDVDAEANTYIVRYGRRRHDDIPIGKDTAVRFVVGRYDMPDRPELHGQPKMWLQARLDERDDSLRISTDHGIAVHPTSSNVIHVTRERR